MIDINGNPVRPDRDYDVEFTHRPIFFCQGEDAYSLIDLDDQDRELFLNSLWQYLPDDISDIASVSGEPKPLNYRVEFRETVQGKSYRIGYTTGDGGCLGVDLIEERYIPIGE